MIEAGEKLDRLVAHHVMAWSWTHKWEAGDCGILPMYETCAYCNKCCDEGDPKVRNSPCKIPPQYSTQKHYAMLVFEWLAEDHNCSVRLEAIPYDNDPTIYNCIVSRSKGMGGIILNSQTSVNSESLPYSICRAALLALEEK
jgi:hypothetical protein